MTDADWDTVTKIGSKARGPGANVQKEKVIRGESALNAARRQGADIATEKKFGGTNSVCRVPFTSFLALSAHHFVLQTGRRC